jgi:methionyl-tRNA formyltransferase
MKLVFCGTPEFAVPSLETLLAAGHEVALVLTQPDRPAGRKMELQISAVKKVAIERGLPLLQPEKIKANPELRALLESIRPDAIIVVAYGRIIPEWMLALPRLGCINVHGSLLPKYRGAAPIQWAVANGETETGVTTMLLDSGLDTGPMLLSQSIFLSSNEMTVQLYPQFSHSGAELLMKTLQGLEAGTLEPQPQVEAQATLAPILTRKDGQMELTRRTARQVYGRWRGFYPWPGAHGVFRNKRFLVHRMEPVAEAMDLQPGVLGFVNGELFVGAAGTTALRLDEVQMEGKPRMAGAAFAKDFQVKAGERLD